MLFLAGLFVADFAFWLFGSSGSSWVFFLRVRGGVLCIHFFSEETLADIAESCNMPI